MDELKVDNWDLFISHASEDKAAFVAPLASALSAFGVHVWYDDCTLRGQVLQCYNVILVVPSV